MNAVSPVEGQPWRYPQPWRQLGKVSVPGMRVLVSLWEHTWQLILKLSRGLVKEVKLSLLAYQCQMSKFYENIYLNCLIPSHLITVFKK